MVITELETFASEDEKELCPNCGTELEGGVCPNCGAEEESETGGTDDEGNTQM